MTFVRRQLLHHPDIDCARDLFKARDYEAVMKHLNDRIALGVDWTNAAEPVQLSDPRQLASKAQLDACFFYLGTSYRRTPRSVPNHIDLSPSSIIEYTILSPVPASAVWC